MAGDPATFRQHLDHAAGDAQFDLLANQRMRHAVIVAVVLDVVVDIDAGAFPLGQHKPRGRQCPQVGRIQFLEGIAAAAGQFLERPIVQRRQEFGVSAL